LLPFIVLGGDTRHTAVHFVRSSEVAIFDTDDGTRRKPHVEAALVYEIRPTGVLLFMPKYGIKGAVHLVDRAGTVLPPLEEEGPPADPRDPFVLAARRTLRLEHGTAV
jgi:hypothetical protein